MCAPPPGQKWCLCRDALEWAKTLLQYRYDLDQGLACGPVTWYDVASKEVS